MKQCLAGVEYHWPVIEVSGVQYGGGPLVDKGACCVVSSPVVVDMSEKLSSVWHNRDVPASAEGLGLCTCY